jgi:site-specific DNA-methyltransferase (adenine-specific)
MEKKVLSEIMQLFNDNCLKVLPTIPDNNIDLIITSPPYDNMRDYNNSSIWTFDIFKNIANQLQRVLKDGGVIVWIVNDTTIKGSETGTSFKQALYFKEIGLNLHDTMIWQKESNPFTHKNRYINVFEYMFVFSKGKPKTTNLIKDRKNKYGGTKIHGTQREKDGNVRLPTRMGKEIKEYGSRFNVWQINSEKQNKTGHPAVFPINLIQDHIKTWSNENDIVLDCFMGSGTTGLACKNLNRDFIGIEIDNEYFDIAKQRIESTLF